MPNHSEPMHGAPLTVLVSEVRMTCLESAGERGGELPASLVYDPEDPYAVALVFHASEGDVTWMVSRELLVTGARGPAGDGDVMVWPTLTPDLDDAVVIRLQAPSGRLVLRLAMPELDDFLARSLCLVLWGTESAHLDLDALVADLLTPRGRPA
ncbi:SsgA family sporulation/cell division regulator [Nocardioides marinus]|uniref:Streptomyces sporulation and cell division protein, SsgA n=1 Tax=Nocardioides marinus TaxID=374514 RepID=A0A7Z0C4E6_9ACTN|nr:SsgA family sporulation/cell division regulator [Nocardioides marinus]NYI09986.1 hypothetical protein [Nocardioides marinus]